MIFAGERWTARVACALLVCCQSREQATIHRDEVALPNPQQSCLEAAKNCNAALLSGDDEGVLACMPFEAIALAGGRDAVLADLVDRRRLWVSLELHPERVDVDSAPSVLIGRDHTFAVVNEVVVVGLVKGGRLKQRLFAVGVSSDHGHSWKFVDDAAIRNRPLTTDDMKRMFPDFPASLALPRYSAPEFVE